MSIVPVILAGGIGERFWPMSRTSRPKQLLPLTGKKSMLEETLLRIKPLCKGSVSPLIVTSEAIATQVKRQVKSSLRYELIAEPIGKNTAPAVALAAAQIQQHYGDVTMVVLSADHAITPRTQFLEAVRYAAQLATQKQRLVVFGIPPSRPDTGYGYIQVGAPSPHSDTISGYTVKRFVEKPSLKKAQQYCASPSYFWNSGMFVWQCSTILQEFENYMPELYALTLAAARENFSKTAISSFYHAAAKESIDYGILERSKRVSMVAGSFQWDDVGSWDSVSRIHPANEGQTTVVGKRIYQAQCQDSIIFNDSSKHVAVIGADNLVVVSTDDAVLVIPRDKLEQIKHHLGAMKQNKEFPRSLF